MSDHCPYCGDLRHLANCDRESLKRHITVLRANNADLNAALELVQRQLEIRTMELQATRKLEGPRVMMISSLVSHKTGHPRVDIQLGEIHTQMSADAAIDIARNLFEVCAGAYADAFLVNFLKEKLQQGPEVYGQILVDFRAYREELAEEFKKEQEPE